MTVKVFAANIYILLFPELSKGFYTASVYLNQDLNFQTVYI
jgi:hypothetical protein